MRKRNKFIFSVVTLAVSMCFLLVGIYALQERVVSIKGQISFSSNNVFVTYSVSKTAQYASEPTYSLVDSGAFNRTEEGQYEKKNVAMGEIRVNNYQQKFSYKVEFKRLDANFTEDYYISINFPAYTQEHSNVFETAVVFIDGATKVNDYFLVTGDDKVTITVTYSAKEEGDIDGDLPSEGVTLELNTNFSLSLHEPEPE